MAKSKTTAKKSPAKQTPAQRRKAELERSGQTEGDTTSMPDPPIQPTVAGQSLGEHVAPPPPIPPSED